MKTYAIDRHRWAKMTIFEQMGNIHSEVGRALKAKKLHDLEACRQATYRAIDLLDATAEILAKQKSPRLKEVLRSKDQFLGAIYGQTSEKEDKSLDDYFLHYAIAARANR